MELATLIQSFDEPGELAAWLKKIGLRNLARAQANWWSIARSGVTPDLMGTLAGQLSEHLPTLSDADMALNNLDRFFAAARSRLAWLRFSSGTRNRCRRCCRSSAPAST